MADVVQQIQIDGAAPPRPHTLVSVADFAGETGVSVLMNLDPGRYLDEEIRRTGLFEPELTRYLTAMLRPEMVCVDVGANIGYYTVLMARRCRRVLAFEPMADYRTALTRTVQANGLSHVEIFSCGLSNERAERAVRVGQCSATLHWVANEQPRKVEQALFERLDDLVSERVDVLKIDVDGHELRVLQGAAHLLQAHRPIVLFEVSLPHYRHAGADLRECYQWFDDLGYALACETAPSRQLSWDGFLAIGADERRSWNFIATPCRHP